VKRSDMLLVALTLAVGIPLIGFCLFLFYPWYRTEEKALSPRVKLVEKQRLRVLPIIIGTEWRLAEQLLLRDGKKIWSSHERAPATLGRNFQASPDSRFVAFDDWLHAKPVTLLDLETGQEKVIDFAPALRDMRHHGSNHFSVKGWSSDAAALILGISESYMERGTADVTATWQVDPRTGLVTGHSN
jgi:hypothetical protein